MPDPKRSLTFNEKSWLRVLLREQAKVAERKSAWRRGRDTAKHYWPKNAEGRTA